MGTALRIASYIVIIVLLFLVFGQRLELLQEIQVDDLLALGLMVGGLIVALCLLWRSASSGAVPSRLKKIMALYFAYHLVFLGIGVAVDGFFFSGFFLLFSIPLAVLAYLYGVHGAQMSWRQIGLGVGVFIGTFAVIAIPFFDRSLGIALVPVPLVLAGGLSLKDRSYTVSVAILAATAAYVLIRLMVAM